MRGRIALLIPMVLWGVSGCEQEPNKTHYITAQVRKECPATEEPDKCRLEVMKRMIGMSLEDLRARYPEPSRPRRPGCSL